jgi:aspartate/methionine/tyrosine aminotransferase
MKLHPFLLERFFAAHEFSTPYTLCSSDCESLSIGELLDLEPGSDSRLRQLRLEYTQSFGLLSLREQIATLYSRINAEDILVHSGAEEAIFCFMHAVLEPDDHVIVQFPAYQSLFEIAASIGCEVTRWTVKEGTNGWTLDLDFLKSRLRKNTRVVVVNFPHNPTGYVMPPAQYQELVELSQTHGFFLFSDEVYRLLEYDDTSRLPAACDVDDRAVSVGVMSKVFGLGGLRIGWIATKNRRIMDMMCTVKDYTTYSNSAPAEILAEITLQHAREVIRRNMDIIHGNLAVLNAFFEEYHEIFRWSHPDGGPVAFPSLASHYPAESADFCNDLLDKSGVLLLPGTLYDPAYNRHFRIGFGRKNLPLCVDRLKRFLG